jgi:hypothetical protein
LLLAAYCWLAAVEFSLRQLHLSLSVGWTTRPPRIHTGGCWAGWCGG